MASRKEAEANIWEFTTTTGRQEGYQSTARTTRYSKQHILMELGLIAHLEYSKATLLKSRAWSMSGAQQQTEKEQTQHGNLTNADTFVCFKD